MERHITFRSMEHSAALEAHAIKLLAKVENYLQENERPPLVIHVIITGGFVHTHHKIEMLVKTPHYDLAAHAEGPDAYETMRIVADKLQSELYRAKEKRLDRLQSGGSDRSVHAIDKEFKTEEETE